MAETANAGQVATESEHAADVAQDASMTDETKVPTQAIEVAPAASVTAEKAQPSEEEANTAPEKQNARADEGGEAVNSIEVAAADSEGVPVTVVHESGGADVVDTTPGPGDGVTVSSVKVKQEKPDDDVVAGSSTQGFAVKDESSKVKDEQGSKVKAEKTEDEKKPLKNEGVKNEGVKNEGLKNEGASVKTEGTKSEPLKGEALKNEGSGAKKEETKSELKREKGELSAEMYALAKKEEMKAEMKRERSRSPRKKDKKKKEKEGKIKKERRSGSPRRKDKKRKRSKSPEGKDGRKKRKSKWGPDVPIGFTAIPAGRSGLIALPTLEDSMPKFNEEELKQRLVVLENLPSNVTGQELVEFFNGAVLAVTANAVQQASNRSMAPVFGCTVTEEDHGGGDRRKIAELKFRTPEGASVGMKLSGIEYKGGHVKIRRAAGFTLPDDGQDPSAKINLHEMSMAVLVGSVQVPGKPDEAVVSPKLSIFNLPDVMTEQIVRDLLSQFGKLRMLSLIRDLATGKLKGYGIFEYDNPTDVELAILALNGFVCGQNVIRVQKLGGAAQQAAPKPQPVAATAMSNSMTQKIVSNPVLAMQVKQGREVGSRPSTVVQLLNAVYQEDLMDDQDYDDIMAELHAEASKHGTVMRIVMPKPAKDGSFVDGVGKVFISFQDLTAARRFQMDSNGRKFENRVVCSAFYPLDKFSEGKYKLWSS